MRQPFLGGKESAMLRFDAKYPVFPPNGEAPELLQLLNSWLLTYRLTPRTSLSLAANQVRDKQNLYRAG
jgi:hypothetical protein